jgi:hypothetical protein
MDRRLPGPSGPNPIEVPGAADRSARGGKPVKNFGAIAVLVVALGFGIEVLVPALAGDSGTAAVRNVREIAVGPGSDLGRDDAGDSPSGTWAFAATRIVTGVHSARGPKATLAGSAPKRTHSAKGGRYSGVIYARVDRTKTR